MRGLCDRLYNAVNFEWPQTAMVAAANTTIAGMTLDVLLCPSDRAPARAGAGPINYRINLGSALRPIVTNLGGAMEALRWLRPAEFRDGLSNTAALSKKVRGDGRPQRWDARRDFWFAGFSNDPPVPLTDAISRCAAPPSSSVPHNSWAGWCWFLGGYGTTDYNHVVTPNSAVPDCTNYFMRPPFYEEDNPGSGIFPPRSWHPGGVNLTTADGALRFIPNGIAPPVFRALGTRAAGDAVASEP